MTGGVASVVHRLTIDRGGYRDVLVLRQYEREFFAHLDSGTAALIRDEAATLRAVHDAGLPAPEPVAADADGRECDGHPAILMTRLPGRVDVTPADPEGWLRQMATMAVRIHHVQVAAAPPFRSRVDAPAPVVPASATRPAVWEAAFGVLRQQAPETADVLHPPRLPALQPALATRPADRGGGLGHVLHRSGRLRYRALSAQSGPLVRGGLG